MPVNDIVRCSSWCQSQAGVMDMSWPIQWANGRQTHCRFHMPPAPSNIRVRSACLALIEVLKMYLAQGGKRPLYVSNVPGVFFDAQYQPRRHDLATCWPCIAACLQQVQNGVHLSRPAAFDWPTDQATEAGYAVAAPEVSPGLAGHIARLNLRGVATWQYNLHLHCGGRNHSSAICFPALARLVGPVGVERVLQAFGSPSLADTQGTNTVAEMASLTVAVCDHTKKVVNYGSSRSPQA